MSGELSPVPVPAGDRRAPARSSGGSGLIFTLWGLTGVLIGVVLGAAGVGDNLLARYFTPDTRHQRDLLEMTGRLDEIRSDLTSREQELSAERHQRKEAVAALKGLIEAAERSAVVASRQSELLSGLLSYERQRSDANRARLVDTLCRLRAPAGAAGVAVESVPLAFGADEVGKAGAFDSLLALLGVSRELIARARRDPAGVSIPAVTPYNVFEVQRAMQVRRAIMRDIHEAVAAINRQVQAVKLAKAVKLTDGSEHSIPRDVAFAMLARADCRGG